MKQNRQNTRKDEDIPSMPDLLKGDHTSVQNAKTTSDHAEEPIYQH